MDIFTWLAVFAIIGTIFLGFHKRFSYVQVLIIGMLAIFFLTFLNAAMGDDSYIRDLGTEPVYLTNGQNSWTFITYMFVHANFAHVIGNVLFLFLIGVQLEYRVGKNRTALLFFVTGIGAMITQGLMLGLNSHVLMVGASGAVAGLIGAMLWLYPRDKIPMFIGPILLPNVPVILGAGVFLVTQLVLDLAASTGGASGGVAYAAHLGGFVVGMALAAVLPKPAPRVEDLADYSTLEPLATTKVLKDDLERIKNENEPAVRKVWLEHFVKNAKCPQCGGRLELKGGKVHSECGYEAKLK
jgi:membrane associated rhomboid family serine protease